MKLAALAVAAGMLLTAHGASAVVDDETAKIVAGLPIADLHFHPHYARLAGAAQKWMDASGVQWAGAGAVGRRDEPDRSIWGPYAGRLKNRFIAFAGQQSLSCGAPRRVPHDPYGFFDQFSQGDGGVAGE